MADAMNMHDPSEVVIDEAVGMVHCPLYASSQYSNICYSIYSYSGSLIFSNHPFIYQVQNLPDGWGIMLDDVLAGIFAGAICQGLLTDPVNACILTIGDELLQGFTIRYKFYLAWENPSSIWNPDK